MPRRKRKQQQFVCSKCKRVPKKKKSAARVRRGKILADELPRDERGRFLPRGSVNRFRVRQKRTRLPEEGTIGRFRKFRGREI
jgi:hypothetical protein